MMNKFECNTLKRPWIESNCACSMHCQTDCARMRSGCAAGSLGSVSDSPRPPLRYRSVPQILALLRSTAPCLLGPQMSTCGPFGIPEFHSSRKCIHERYVVCVINFWLSFPDFPFIMRGCTSYQSVTVWLTIKCNSLLWKLVPSSCR